MSVALLQPLGVMLGAEAVSPRLRLGRYLAFVFLLGGALANE